MAQAEGQLGGGLPDPRARLPVPGFDVIYVKPTITRANIEVGDFTYYSGPDFESRVTHHYGFYGDKLIIGKFCQIASGVEFMMNGANHQMSAASTFPFHILERWGAEPPGLDWLPLKGDTVVGNDVWIGQGATILAGAQIADGAVIGSRAVVGGDVAPYTIMVGNPARPIRKRLDDELIALLLELKWWDLPIAQIKELIPVLTDPDLARVRAELRRLLRRRSGSAP
ncbi:MAG: CatB-related O-acetyltransferase [Bifidobacteriaceae bacterium]|jgi:virginiamycin A acetyltransferase|nr:CatB-related O-acetyltransferase [Bifidobacteriaceae bacterium]